MVDCSVPRHLYRKLKLRRFLLLVQWMMETNLIMMRMILVGDQIMLRASTFRYVGSLDGLSRVILAGLAVAASYAVVAMLVSVETIMMAGILMLHVQHPFPRITVNGAPVPYVLFNATR